MVLGIATPLTIGGKLADPTLWHTTGEPLQLGCVDCVDKGICGGLSVRAPILNCMELCCGSPATCKRYACPNNPERYSNLVNEVGGLELRPYQGAVAPMRLLPEYVPCISDAGSLRGPVGLQSVCVSLYDVINNRAVTSKFISREEVLARFKIGSSARLVIAGIQEDKKVEPFWEWLMPKKTAAILKKLRPALVTTPNFSIHDDTVRHDNFVSMARITCCFEEFASAGLPVALHVNGRTPRDFDRWTEYLIKSQAAGAIAYEMGTLGRSSRCRQQHTRYLVELAKNVGRPLTLVVRAGSSHLQELAAAFARVIHLDTSASFRAKYRQSAHCSDGKLQWRSHHTRPGEPIDDLFIHNTRVCGRYVRRQIAMARTRGMATALV